MDKMNNFNYGNSDDSHSDNGYMPTFVLSSDSGECDSPNNPKDSGNTEKNKKTSKKYSFSKKALIICITACIVISGIAGFGGSLLANRWLPYETAADINAHSKNASSKSKTAGYTLENATGSHMTIREIADATENSIVEIKTEGITTDSWMQQYVTKGAGSGIIIKKNGYIMTNNHVIDGAGKITVTLKNRKEYDATIVGADAESDIAVLKIAANRLTPVTYGNSNQLDVGDLAVAIGNPLGTLGGTVTAGIISALERELTIDNQTMTLIQTDSSINPGNSGGGLFNQNAQLIGVVVAKSSGSDVEGLGFAIPVNTAAKIAEELIGNGYVSGRPATGMSYTDVNNSSDETRNGDYFFGFGGGQSSQQQLGVYIASVNSSEAKKAGFKKDDLVYSVNGKIIDSFSTLKSIIRKHKVGDKLNYVVVRKNKELKLILKLVEQSKANS